MKDFKEHEERKKSKRAKDSKRFRTDYPRQDHREEEYAAEVAPPRSDRYEIDEDKDRTDDESIGRTAGYVGLACGIASLFMWSVVLGPVAAIAGFYAYSKGSRVMGAWGMGLGILATLSYFILIPFTR
ncbi:MULTISPECIES: hypothetical protein [Paenibacillus]|jgi:hypothetical protein|uniref:DUF4190 domain-containing protein n=1 Tax=Paenibacillus azoreducens TaxID=116718 RepID=A0A919YBS2_9BACL|nr:MULTISPECIES: hypothetical protein [Paenibacillus]MBE9912793.1 MFS transporter [Paenibacillus donghaensis]GIO47809.1 hypothetical protein J34TS1_25740 [Paenibacillus azoreducens]